MNRNIMCAFFSVCAALCASLSYGSSVTWTIDSTQSFSQLALSDAVLNLNGTPATIRIRNQTGSSNVWNQGNKAFLSGTIASDYSANSIQFLTGLNNITSLNSGNYRPNPAAFSPVPSADNGAYLNNSSAPAAVG